MLPTIAVLAMIFYVALNIVFLLWDFVRCIVGEESYELPLLPNEMKRASRMNWVGCILTSIPLLALVPISYILRAVVFLFHV